MRQGLNLLRYRSVSTSGLEYNFHRLKAQNRELFYFKKLIYIILFFFNKKFVSKKNFIINVVNSKFSMIIFHTHKKV